MNLYHCQANGPFGRFGDYVYAATRAEAERRFYQQYGYWPTYVTIERRARR